MSDKAYTNTDRELWRRPGDGDGAGSYYEPSVHVTDDDLIGINVGGLVFVKPVEEWHALAHMLDTSERESDRLAEALLSCKSSWTIDFNKMLRYRRALREIRDRHLRPCGVHEAPLPHDVANAEYHGIAREALYDDVKP